MTRTATEMKQAIGRDLTISELAATETTIDLVYARLQFAGSDISKDDVSLYVRCEAVRHYSEVFEYTSR